MKLVGRSHEIWAQLEAETHDQLFIPTGVLLISEPERRVFVHGRYDFFETTVALADKYSICHEVLTSDEIRARYPQFQVPSRAVGYLEPGAGVLLPEKCIAAQLSQARSLGAEVKTNEPVLRIDSDLKDGSSVRVTTKSGEYVTKRVILTVGPWLKSFLPSERGDESSYFRITRQVAFWFAIESEDHSFDSSKAPGFIWTYGPNLTDGFYGFPNINAGNASIKVAAELDVEVDDVASLDRTVGEGEARAMYDEYLRDRLVGITSDCVRAEVCLYTETPDYNFVIQQFVDRPGVVLVSACSGHGFKHSAAIGEAVAELALTGTSPLAISSFCMKK